MTIETLMNFENYLFSMNVFIKTVCWRREYLCSAFFVNKITADMMIDLICVDLITQLFTKEMKNTHAYIYTH